MSADRAAVRGALLEPPQAAFFAEVRALDEHHAARMRGRSWHDDPRCPRWEELALVVANHVDFRGDIVVGELVVARGVAGPAVQLLRRLYTLGFPIGAMRPIDEFDGDDHRSMVANNSSAFNFRVVAGTNVLSEHAFGIAVDLNPLVNPMVFANGDVVPTNDHVTYADRRQIRPGMIVRPGPVTAALDELGWQWGGDWLSLRDYHHIVWPGARG